MSNKTATDDKAIWTEMEHLRAKLIARRRDIYLNRAAEIARSAGEIVLDNADWSKLAASEDRDGTPNPTWVGARRNRQIAAVGDLGMIIRHQAAKLGVLVRVHEGPATWRCHRCGGEMERRRPADLYQFGHIELDGPMANWYPFTRRVP